MLQNMPFFNFAMIVVHQNYLKVTNGRHFESFWRILLTIELLLIVLATAGRRTRFHQMQTFLNSENIQGFEVFDFSIFDMFNEKSR